MNLTLEISNEQDAELILSLVKRLNVPFIKNEKRPLRQPKMALAGGRASNQKAAAPENLLAQVAKPVAETFDVEALKKAQNWRGPDRKGLMQLIDKMDIQEPIEQLLTQIAR